MCVGYKLSSGWSRATCRDIECDDLIVNESERANLVSLAHLNVSFALQHVRNAPGINKFWINNKTEKNYHHTINKRGQPTPKTDTPTG